MVGAELVSGPIVFTGWLVPWAASSERSGREEGDRSQMALVWKGKGPGEGPSERGPGAIGWDDSQEVDVMSAPCVPREVG